MRLFTPTEANELLPRVRPLAERLVDLRRAMRADELRLAEIRRAVLGNGAKVDPREQEQLRSALATATDALGRVLDELAAVGVEVKDVDIGLLDFPARHPNGDTVLLCWQVGEDAVSWWHGVEEGYAGRKPLPF